MEYMQNSVELDSLIKHDYKSSDQKKGSEQSAVDEQAVVAIMK